MKRILRVLLVLSVLVSMVALPYAASAGPAKAGDTPGGIGIASNTATPDAWENTDDSSGTATNITSLVPAAGAGVLTQTHTLDLAAADTCDVDWFRLDVSEDELAIDGVTFLIEAVTEDPTMDTVVEVYRLGDLVGIPVSKPWSVDPGARAGDDDDNWGGLGSACEFTPGIDPGTHGQFYIRVRPYWFATTGYDDHAGTYTLRVQRTLASRVAGADRIATAIAASKLGYMTRTTAASDADKVAVVANAFNYPDALSGSSLIGGYLNDGPILLTPQDSLPVSVGNEIKRIGAKTVYVLGGPDVVSDHVFSQIQALDPGIGVYRLQGDDRIYTSIEIAEQLHARMGTRRFAILAYANNYPDALAATPMSARLGIPILLTRTATLPDDTLSIMNAIGVTDVIIVGDEGVVSQDVEDTCLQEFGVDHVLRLAGPDRYATARAIADWSCDLAGPGTRGDGMIGTTANPIFYPRMSINQFGVASGENFPDALSGGALAGSNGFPLLLTPKASLSKYIVDYYNALPAGQLDFYEQAGMPYWGKCVIFGGTGAVSPTTQILLGGALGMPAAGP